ALSTDTAYGYDLYGNNTSITTYPASGVTTYTYGTTEANLTVAYSPPGNCALPCTTGRTTTTGYDTTFHSLPMTATYPTTAAGVTLVEKAGYDFRMGTMTSVIDPNDNTTSAEYDGFGRMLKLMKPGATTTSPTSQFFYYDTEYVTRGKPFRYVQRMWVTEPINGRVYRPLIQFYDGMGRQIQTRNSSKYCAQMIVVDKQYDAFGQVTAQAQPRYVETPNGCDVSSNYSFANYAAPPQDGSVKWTTTEYDAQGRSTKVTDPDNTFATMRYDLGTNTYLGLTMQQVVTVDARNNKKAHLSDILGRLSQVKEFTSTTATSAYATTNYGYSPLDLLTVVTDTNNYTTTMTYDALGRKVQMRDLTMGLWSYAYDPNGNLTGQTDAKNQTITFRYDVLDRLIGKDYSVTADSIVYNYDQAAAVNGKGQRTSMSRNGFVTNWQYDNRGRQVKTDYTIPGLTGARTYTQGFDDADRLTSMSYPSGELVEYKYDDAWRQTGVCSKTISTPCYANNISYTALNQTAIMPFGNGLLQRFTYDSVMQRLQQLQVGTTASPGSVMNKSYAYDAAGNVATITNTLNSEVSSYTYDHLDRLTGWSIPALLNQQYAYDTVGNITSKVSVTYGYTPGAAQNGGPYAVRTTSDGGSYTYDANGNMLANGLGRTLTWNADNMPTQIVSGSTTEQYYYDGDGSRVKRVSGTTTT
ncbi:MAG: RHS repeat protein, partial [Chloroflexota bacterium]|nr:RHS repeat protein [Chloroflexota bacterium]